jgi:hypothetical protein
MLTRRNLALALAALPLGLAKIVISSMDTDHRQNMRSNRANF